MADRAVFVELYRGTDQLLRIAAAPQADTLWVAEWDVPLMRVDRIVVRRAHEGPSLSTDVADREEVVAEAVDQGDPMRHWHVRLRHPYGGYIDLGYHTEHSARELVGDLTSAVHAYQTQAREGDA